jgi:hypothetical protein
MRGKRTSTLAARFLDGHSQPLASLSVSPPLWVYVLIDELPWERDSSSFVRLDRL